MTFEFTIISRDSYRSELVLTFTVIINLFQLYLMIFFYLGQIVKCHTLNVAMLSESCIRIFEPRFFFALDIAI